MAVNPAHGEPADDAPSTEIPELHELEFAVMEQVWRLGRASVHTVHRELNATDPRERAYTTILSVMRRLHQKGFLRRERRDRTDFYTPLISRDEYAHTQARAVVNLLVDQFGDVALAHFARHVERLSLEQLAKLRRLADEQES